MVTQKSNDITNFVNTELKKVEINVRQKNANL